MVQNYKLIHAPGTSHGGPIRTTTTSPQLAPLNPRMYRPGDPLDTGPGWTTKQLNPKNPLSDKPNWDTGGRESPSYTPDAKYMYIGLGLLAVVLLMRKKK